MIFFYDIAFCKINCYKKLRFFHEGLKVREKRVKKGLCGICPSGCGVEITMEGEHLHQIKPMEGHPLGIVCTRGVHAEEIIYSPDRIKFPMKRIGDRGNGKLERISWEEAFELSARLIQGVVEKYGPETMAIYSGRGGFEQSLLDLFTTGGHDTICSNLLFPLGSPNTFSCSSLCNNSHREHEFNLLSEVSISISRAFSSSRTNRIFSSIQKMPNQEGFERGIGFG